jgi:hypothetical protein
MYPVLNDLFGQQPLAILTELAESTDGFACRLRLETKLLFASLSAKAFGRPPQADVGNFESVPGLCNYFLQLRIRVVTVSEFLLEAQ